MALIKCSECGKEISDKAGACIHCGYPMPQLSNEYTDKTNNKRTMWQGVMIVAIIAVCILALVYFISNSIQKKYSNSTNEQSILSTSGERLSLILTEEYLDDIYDNFVDVQAPLVDALMHYGEFETEEDIENFERTWKLAIDSLDKVIKTLSTHIPASDYEEIWNNLYNNLQKLRELCVPFTNLDPNGDGTYTSAEGDAIYNEKVPLFKDTLVLTLKNCKDFLITKEIYAAPEPVESKPMGNNQSAESSNKCSECGNSASYDYKNPFSGEKESYCYTHYKEIIDIMGDMEADVGDFSQSKYTCEKCSREGSRVYHSFTGQTEYYCSKHYEELMDMLAAFGLG